MNSKALIALCALIIIAVAAGGYSYARHARTAAPAASPYQISVNGLVTAISTSSISVEDQDGVRATLGIDSSTQVISEARSGETGKGISDIKIGDMVAVRVLKASHPSASILQIFAAQDAIGAAASDVPPAYVLGMVTQASPSMLEVAPKDGGESVQVAVTSKTTVLSNVLAGQKGKSLEDIAVGSRVYASGALSGASLTADSIQILDSLPIAVSAQ